MKSRVAILGMLVTGILFSTAGAGLALSGVPSQHDASVSQYQTPTPTPTCTPSQGSTAQGGKACEEGGILPAEETNAPSSGSAPAGGGKSGGVLPATETQPVRQAAAAAKTSQLPFTGYAAIPVLLGGLFLLTGGLILRRRTN